MSHQSTRPRTGPEGEDTTEETPKAGGDGHHESAVGDGGEGQHDTTESLDENAW